MLIIWEVHTLKIFWTLFYHRDNTLPKNNNFGIFFFNKRIQSVSATPATKQDVLDLQEKLDKRLQQRQAR